MVRNAALPELELSNRKGVDGKRLHSCVLSLNMMNAMRRVTRVRLVRAKLGNIDLHQRTAADIGAA